MRRVTRTRALLTLLAVSSAALVLAQTSISTDGIIESTAGGFAFPDGSVQTTAASPGLAPVEDSGQQTCWDPSGDSINEIPCSGTGQDGALQKGVDWPAPRFTDNLDGTVTDRLTGLVWLRDADCKDFLAPVVFEDALAEANTLAEGGCGLSDGSLAGDWRLPNIKEFLSLVDYGESSPALPSGHPFLNVQTNAYWSSTSIVELPSTAWFVDFVPAGSDGSNTKSGSLFMWPVRDGQ